MREKISEVCVGVYDEWFLTERENGLKTPYKTPHSLWTRRVVNNKLCGDGNLIHFNELKQTLHEITCHWTIHYFNVSCDDTSLPPVLHHHGFQPFIILSVHEHSSISGIHFAEKR
jgi:hypothetical protein